MRYFDGYNDLSRWQTYKTKYVEVMNCYLQKTETSFDDDYEYEGECIYYALVYNSHELYRKHEDPFVLCSNYNHSCFFEGFYKILNNHRDDFILIS